MTIDISRDELIPLAQVSELSFVPRRRKGQPLHRATPYRWSTTGLRGVKLETVQFAGTRCTTLRALREFVDRLSDPDSSNGNERGILGAEPIADVDERLDEAGL